ncbi:MULTISPECIES: Holliday junction branch migration protein RuvA [Prochlorococcus]|uniref:Holliday junction branch migration complex subunit RuvA n=1 Tax=Prochlorococcus marinus (strain SARG / CCMP1375 / SS120) TaxID=167539 RepID=RUVA_PROMA|nr:MULTISPECIES: Holliday junction branch migration protein RuvA [Prochlorococcus]Q7VCI6.1 RecName: Full=Holliday junction branch migration complex subunit RuvA [Prochlorococcus marinus subsp. marinus str. CCMP1375]AAP99798.1 Holliday junction resolvasome DNA-binding subunit [Prochlorococcus marinus subsp. marinus str. CCMP1375]KGG11856.1 Holliday junction DNA helicase RuvA [Prochlorococcus marinus str. LG]KGG21837.1 Holliday junction DNA helicase RuvA [Prochlorococcus marinus str. SS2]KGG2373
MISWLNGLKIEIWENGTRKGVLISCSGVGYEVQLLSRSLQLLNTSKELILWVHEVHREDGSQLIGFLNKLERDLFRKLISVSGVGPQLAISLLEKNPAEQLISAITKKKIAQLTSCPGVGKKTAERLVIELQNKLSDLIGSSLKKTNNHLELEYETNVADEVRSTLLNLDYKNSEIEKAFLEFETSSKSIRSKAQESFEVSKGLDFETLLKETLIRINTESG